MSNPSDPALPVAPATAPWARWIRALFRWAVLGTGILAVLAFYHWTYITNFRGEPAFPYFADRGLSLYQLSVDGYQAGQLSFLVKPSPELLALPDPYDDVANAPFAMRDASLYNGKYYLYFGPVPALTLYLPLKLMLGHHTSDGVVVFLMGTGCFLMSVLILFRCRSLLRGPGYTFALFISILAVGLNNFFGHFLRRPQVFEAAIISASFWLLVAVWSMVSFFSTGAVKKRYLLLSSLAVGLAIGCRYSYLLSSALLLVPVLHVLLNRRRDEPLPYRALVRRALVSFGPWALVMGLFLLHNYLRFDNPLEFGQKYQLTGVTISKLQLASLRYVPHNFNYYFLSFIRPDLIFPFFHEFSNQPLLNIATPEGYHAVWNSVGVFNSPFILFALLAPWALLGFSPRSGLAANHAARWCLLCVVVAAAANISVLLVFCGIVVRYLLDFVPLLLLTASISYLLLESRWQLSRGKLVLLRTTAGIFLCYGILSNLGLGMEGEYQVMKTRVNPPFFKTMEDRFDFVPRFFFSESDYGRLSLRMRFSGAKDDRADPLVATGRGWLSDMLVVAHPSENTIRFGLYHGLGDADGKQGTPVVIDPNREYTVVVSMGSLYPRPYAFLLRNGYDERLANSFQVTLDDTVVLEGTGPFNSAFPAQVHVGQNLEFPTSPYFNPAMFNPRYPGAILEQKRLPFLRSTNPVAGTGSP